MKTRLPGVLNQDEKADGIYQTYVKINVKDSISKEDTERAVFRRS